MFANAIKVNLISLKNTFFKLIIETYSIGYLKLN